MSQMSNQLIVDLIEKLFPVSVYINCAREMQSINPEMQDMLINLYTMLYELSKESNDRQISNIKELAKQYAEMVLVSPVREQLENTQKQLENIKKQLALTQEQLVLTQKQLTIAQATNETTAAQATNETTAAQVTN